MPPVRVLVLTGIQTGLARSVAASTTTETFVAQELSLIHILADEIIIKEYIHLGIAVDTDQGLSLIHI